MHGSHQQEYFLTEGCTGMIVLAATAGVAVVTAVVVVGFLERGEPARQVGGDRCNDGWDIVDRLVIEGYTVQ